MSSQIVSVVVAALAAVLLAGVGCKRRDDALASDACTTAAELPPRTVVVAPPVAPDLRAATPAPAVTTTSPPSDRPPAQVDASVNERPLAPWTPPSAPLTIVHAPDLAQNLGLVDAAVAAPPALVTPAPAPPAADAAP
jgi:hypothetical protein